MCGVLGAVYAALGTQSGNSEKENLIITSAPLDIVPGKLEELFPFLVLDDRTHH